jgi:hypothetical protein
MILVRTNHSYLRVGCHTGGRRLPEWWAALARLVRLHVINRVIACSYICRKNLSCGEGTRVDCCDMIAANGDNGMAIITPGMLYFVLSCRLTPTDVPHCTGDMKLRAPWLGHTFHQEWAWKLFGPGSYLASDVGTPATW